MRVRFWGVRGSLPAPETSERIKSKIAAVLEKLTPVDVESPENRDRFLAGLSPSLTGTVGGNTSCVGLSLEDFEEEIIFDAGSGIRELGMFMSQQESSPSRYHLFFSHYHWDHLQGLPFFSPAYNPSVTVDFYSPLPGLEAALRGQMISPYFPVGLEAMGCKKNFHELNAPVTLGRMTVSFKKLSHPGGAYAFMADNGKHRFVYATDTELTADDFVKKEENIHFFQNADLAVVDAQYTLGEAIDKINWGHNSFSIAVDFAANWGIKHLVLFHHDPSYDDRKLLYILQSARGYMDKMNVSGLQVTLAVEGVEIVL